MSDSAVTRTGERIGLATVSMAAALSAHTLGVQLSVYNVMPVGAQELAWDASSRRLAYAGKFVMVSLSLLILVLLFLLLLQLLLT